MNKAATILKTLKVRLKDKHATLLKQWAFECNQVWNEANAITADFSYVPVPEVGFIRNHFSAFDLAKSQAAFRKARGFTIHSQTVQEVTEAHAKARKQFKKDKLRWRVSGGSRHSLGWIPFKSGAAVWKNGQVRYNGHFFKVWDSYGLSQYAFRSGSFTEDSRGRWYFNVVVQVIVVGNVSSSGLAKTKMAKSVLDAGWFMLKTQLDYKSKAMQGVFLEVNEAYSTQACSCCGSVSINSPKGRAGLGIREWTCPDCGALHDRDVNAARNILAAGHCRLAGGIPRL